LQDIQTGPMPVNRGEGSGSVGIGELEPLSFDIVRDGPRVIGHLGVSLNEFPRGVNDRALHIPSPAVLTGVALSSILPALLDSRGVNFLCFAVIDHGHGVSARATLGAIHPPRQADAIF